MGSFETAESLLNNNSFKPVDAEEFRRQGYMLIDFLADYYQNVEKYPVMSQVEPGYLKKRLPDSAPHHPEPIEDIIQDVKDHIMPGITHWMSPNFFAYFPGSGSTAGFLGEMLCTGFNTVGFNWLASPAATELESIVMDWLGKLLKLPESFLFSGGGGGVLQGTTCEAILCTVIAARDQKLREIGRDNINKLVVYCSDQTHSAFQKAARLAGIHPDNIRSIRTTKEMFFALSPSSLRSAINSDIQSGLIPLFLCATVGTTSTTAMDPLGPLCEVARDYGMWVHVDAAYAGNACICPEFRQLLDGVEGANSISLNAHKWLLVHLDCCCLWVKDPNALIKSLSSNPEFLRNKASDSKQILKMEELADCGKEIDEGVVHRLEKDFNFRIGMTFSDEEDAFNAYNAYAYNLGFGVRKGQKYYNRQNELRRCKFLWCCQGFSPEVLPHEERRIERTIKRCGCHAYVKFKIERGVWEVIELNPIHNHPFILENQKYLIRSSRKITETCGSVLSTMHDVGIKATKAYSFLKSEAGGAENVGCTYNDCKFFLQSKRMDMFSTGDCQSLLNSLRSLQSNGSNLFYSFQVDSENRMTNFFWCDGLSRADYACFGDVVTFDTTYRTNKYNMICAPFVGINHHWKNVLFCCAFLVDETIQSFVWVFKTFLEAMSNKAPKTIFTDQDQAMANAINTVFPHTSHRLCIWHILQNAKLHISHLLSKLEFKDKFYEICHNCESEAEMEEIWKQMYEEWNLVENKWLNNLYKIRHKWCPAFGRDIFSAGVRSTQRSESTNNVFHILSCKTMTLTEFVFHYEKEAEKMREAEVADDFENARGKVKLRVQNNGILRHASSVYTHAIFRKFQAEFLEITSEHVVGVENNELSHTFVLKTENSRREHVVLYNQSDFSLTCSCKMFEMKGWLCRHALCILNNVCNATTIPSQYILKRWTKAAKEGVIVNEIGSSSQHIKKSKTLRLKNLMRKAFNIMSLSADNDETEAMACKALDELEAQIKIFRSNSGKVNGVNASRVIDDLNCLNSSNEKQVLDPLQRRPKGISNKRLKSSIEARRKKATVNKAPPQYLGSCLPPNLLNSNWIASVNSSILTSCPRNALNQNLDRSCPESQVHGGDNNMSYTMFLNQASGSYIGDGSEARYNS